MKHEIMHRAYTPMKGGMAVPESGMINDLNHMADHYIGTFSEYNPIGYEDGIAVYVRKENCKSTNWQKDFKLPGYQLEGGTHFHGSDFNNNKAIEFSKQDLLRIANAMDDTDTLQIAVPDQIDVDKFDSGVEKVTGI